MRRMLKRITSMVLVIALACGVFGAVPVSAASLKYDKKVIVYLGGPSGNQDAITHTYADINITNCNAKPKNVKISSSNVGLTNVFYDSSSKTAAITVSAFKAGTYTVTFKVKGTQYSSQVTFKKYKNPVSTLKITGVRNNKNIASKTAANHYGSAKLNKNVSNAKLTIKPASGWRLTEVEVSRYKGKSGSFEKQMLAKSYKTSKKKTISLGNLKKSKTYILGLTFENKKNGAQIYLEYSIN